MVAVDRRGRGDTVRALYDEPVSAQFDRRHRPRLARRSSFARQIGLLSSIYFLVFGLTQIPLGIALDRFGPRICLLVGAAVTVLAASRLRPPKPQGLIAGRALMGLGPGALVGALAVYARRFPAHPFSTLTGLQVGVGTVGALIATAPLGFSTATIGWRGSFLGLATLAFVVVV